MNKHKAIVYLDIIDVEYNNVNLIETLENDPKVSKLDTDLVCVNLVNCRLINLKPTTKKNKLFIDFINCHFENLDFKEMKNLDYSIIGRKNTFRKVKNILEED